MGPPCLHAHTRETRATRIQDYPTHPLAYYATCYLNVIAYLHRICTAICTTLVLWLGLIALAPYTQGEGEGENGGVTHAAKYLAVRISGRWSISCISAA